MSNFTLLNNQPLHCQLGFSHVSPIVKPWRLAICEVYILKSGSCGILKSPNIVMVCPTTWLHASKVRKHGNLSSFKSIQGTSIIHTSYLCSDWSVCFYWSFLPFKGFIFCRQAGIMQMCYFDCLTVKRFVNITTRYGDSEPTLSVLRS